MVPIQVKDNSDKEGDVGEEWEVTLEEIIGAMHMQAELKIMDIEGKLEDGVEEWEDKKKAVVLEVLAKVDGITVKLVEQKLDWTVMVAHKEIGKGIGLSKVQTTTSFLHSLINDKMKGFYHFMMFFFTFVFLLLLFYTTFQKSSLPFISIV